jgi:hypothetical protein
MPAISQHLEAREVCCASCRSPSRYLEVVKQFDVENNPRYKVRDTSGDGKPDTFCNIFLWDVTRAMGCEIEHWWDGKELSANGVADWLVKEGSRYGWQDVGLLGAADQAARGRPTIAVWKNPGGTGHVAVVVPTGNGQLQIAQAGRLNFFDKPLRSGFGDHPVKFYTHN